MFPWRVDPAWYAAYWYAPPTRRKHWHRVRAVARRIAELLVQLYRNRVVAACDADRCLDI